MTVSLPDLALLSQRMLTAIVRDERLGEHAARKANIRKLKNRLRCYISDNRIPDPGVGRAVPSAPLLNT
jgi:hypothetical protein